MTTILKWFLAALTVVGAFVVAGVLGGLITELAGLWHLPGAGFSAALAVVSVAYAAAPSNKVLCACGVFLIGVIVAWLILEPSFLPEIYGERGAYEQTHLPLIATYLGGVFGLLFVIALKLRSGPNNSFKPKPLRGSA